MAEAASRDPRKLTVVAAVIEQDGKLLICQRRRTDAFPLKWEFPGGKVQPGENAQDALRRELKEELGVNAEIGAELFRTQHQYREHVAPLELIFYRVTMKDQRPRNLAFEQMVWAPPAALPHYDFLDADRNFVVGLARGLDGTVPRC